MLHAEFVGSASNRKRYWLRSLFGFGAFQATKPNEGHLALAALQERYFISNIITQNVDRLHHAANSQNILELHGTLHTVGCLNCGATLSGRFSGAT